MTGEGRCFDTGLLHCIIGRIIALAWNEVDARNIFLTDLDVRVRVRVRAPYLRTLCCFPSTCLRLFVAGHP
ncbi:hypothetical protein [Methylocella sp.]|uniref:hypothetical protein n=1 Tax=Methylocella sp. TaxID=1978226 RepID=UPI0035B13FFE